MSRCHFHSNRTFLLFLSHHWVHSTWSKSICLPFDIMSQFYRSPGSCSPIFASCAFSGPTVMFPFFSPGYRHILRGIFLLTPYWRNSHPHGSLTVGCWCGYTVKLIFVWLRVVQVQISFHTCSHASWTVVTHDNWCVFSLGSISHTHYMRDKTVS